VKGSRGRRWLRWVSTWLVLILGLGFGLYMLFGPLVPGHFPWSAGFLLGTALTFFLAPVPTEDE
jgi:hypothetical protein